jgi:[acyl-carrier-protein] S-malonyltransferase
MGRNLAQAYPAARAVFQQADEILSQPLSQWCFEGPEATLTDTINAQPAILTTSVAAWRALEAAVAEQGQSWVWPGYCAGHSMGEITALVFAGVLDFASGLRLVRERGRLMKMAGEIQPGGMAAVMGAELPVLEEVCAQASAEAGVPVQLANDNCPGQVVISGDQAALSRLMAIAPSRGIRKIKALAVSIAAHSPLMVPALPEYQQLVENTPMRVPRLPVVSNITARPLPDLAAIRSEIPAQLTSAVHWTDSVRWLIAQGVTTFIEIGPKDVLTGLLKRIDGNARGIKVQDPAGVEEAITILLS